MGPRKPEAPDGAGGAACRPFERVNSEGASPPFRNLPPRIDCAGDAGARNGTPMVGDWSGASCVTPSPSRAELGGGLRPPSETSPQESIAPAKPALETEHRWSAIGQ